MKGLNPFDEDHSEIEFNTVLHDLEDNSEADSCSSYGDSLRKPLKYSIILEFMTTRSIRLILIFPALVMCLSLLFYSLLPVSDQIGEDFAFSNSTLYSNLRISGSIFTKFQQVSFSNQNLNSSWGLVRTKNCSDTLLNFTDMPYVWNGVEEYDSVLSSNLITNQALLSTFSLDITFASYCCVDIRFSPPVDQTKIVVIGFAPVVCNLLKRVMTFIASIVLLFFWISRVFRVLSIEKYIIDQNSSDDAQDLSPWRAIMPEQIFAFFMLISFIISQEMMTLVIFELFGRNSPVDWKSFLRADIYLSKMGDVLFAYTLWLLCDSIGYGVPILRKKRTNNSDQNLTHFWFSLKERSPRKDDHIFMSPSKKSYESVPITSESRFVDTLNSLRHIQGYSPYHVLSPLFPDYVWKKTWLCILIGILSIVVVRMDAFPNHRNPTFLLSSACQIICDSFYFIFPLIIIKTLIDTKNRLRCTKYALSKSRQLIFGLLTMQCLIYMVIVLTVFLYDVYHHKWNLRLSLDCLFELGYGLYGELTNRNYTFASKAYWCISLLLLILAVCPVEESLEDHLNSNYSHNYYTLEKYGVEWDNHRQWSDSNKRKTPYFCLETACRLMEASFQAYYSAESDKGRSSNPFDEDGNEGNDEYIKNETGTIPIDIRRHGFNLQAIVSNVDTNTFGFISTFQSQTSDSVVNGIVISFRGSVIANVGTDLNIRQKSIASFKRSRQYWTNIMDIAQRSMEQDLLRQDSFAGHGNIGENSIEEENDLDLSYQESEAPNSPIRMPTSHETQSSTEFRTGTIIDKASQSLISTCLSALPIFNQALPRIHEGFWEAYSSIRFQFHLRLVITIIKLLRNLEPQNQLRIRFCGHSLGGALACLASLDIAQNWPRILAKIKQSGLSNTRDISNDLHHVQWSLYTFGAPRIGNMAFVALVNRFVPVYFRVEIDGDFIAMIPKIFNLYKHGGELVLLDASANGSLLIQPSIVDLQLWRSSQGNLSNHTLNKYRDCLEACFDDEQELREYLSKEFHETEMDIWSTNQSSSSRASSTPLISKKGIPDWMVRI